MTLTTGRGMYGDGELMVDRPTRRHPRRALPTSVADMTAQVAGVIRPDPTGVVRAGCCRRRQDGAPSLAVPGELGVTATGVVVEHNEPADRCRSAVGPVPTGTGWSHSIRLRDAARAVMVAQTGTPDAARAYAPGTLRERC